MHIDDSVESFLSRVNAPDNHRKIMEDMMDRRGALSPGMRDTDMRPSLLRGLQSSPSKEDCWTGVASMDSLDTPVLNSGARLGCGRGRYRPSDDLGDVVKPGIGRGMGGILPYKFPVYASTPKKKVDQEAAAGSSSSAATAVVAPDVIPPATVVSDIDERYLPRLPNARDVPKKSARLVYSL